ncbi:MAG: CHASE2 domain-containing protein, partial [Nitrospinales bacterium]
MKQKFFLGLLGAAVSILLAAGLDDLFQVWEWKTLDFRFQLRGPIPTSPSLLMIDADDASAGQYGRWPWNRAVHADMIRLLAREKVRVAAYDILFAHPADPDGDIQLAGAVETAGNVIFPAAVSLPDNGNRRAVPGRLAPLPLETVVPDVPAAQRFLSVGDSIAPLPPLVQAARAVGHIAANRDRDGVVRRVPLLVRYGDRLFPSLAFQAVMLYLEVAGSSLEIGRHYILLKQAKFPDRDKAVDIRIPIDSKGQMLVNFAGRWEDTFKHASFASALTQGGGEEGEDLSGKLALVSNTLSGHDIKPVPVEKDYPGGGIHANIINTILTRNFLRETHVSFNHSLIVLLCLATAAIFSLRNYLLETGLLAGLLGAYTAGSIFLFHAGHVLPLFTPLLAIVLTALLSAIYRANVEQKISGNLLDEKRRMETYLDSISKDLQRKEEELGKIQRLLSEMRQGIEQDRALGKAQEEKIADLQRKHQALVEDKHKLQTERTELKNAVLDLRVHISFDEIKVEEDLRQLKEECRRFGIITQSRLVLEAFRILKQSAAVPSPILILGDSGTGKELFARAAHQMSPRRGKRFVAVNMAAIPDTLVESELFGHARGAFTGAFAAKKGKFSEADGGTFFLDEIAEM